MIIEKTILLYGNWIMSGLLLVWGVLIKLDVYSEREAIKLYRKWKLDH